jgi:hypothetical protein
VREGRGGGGRGGARESPTWMLLVLRVPSAGMDGSRCLGGEGLR